MKTITFTPDSISLSDDGHIYLMENYELSGPEVRATTNTSIPNVKHIERSLFVKPEVDVEELAHRSVEKYYFENVPKSVVYKAFLAGYNANKKEFTREEMEQAFEFGRTMKYPEKAKKFADIAYHISVVKEKFFNSIRPLSLPKSVECDQEYNVISVKW